MSRWYSAEHYRRLQGVTAADNTPERIAERVARTKAGELAHAETLAKFGTFTEQNAAEALKFQEGRIADHYARLTKIGVSR